MQGTTLEMFSSMPFRKGKSLYVLFFSCKLMLFYGPTVDCDGFYFSRDYVMGLRIWNGTLGNHDTRKK